MNAYNGWAIPAASGPWKYPERMLHVKDRLAVPIEVPQPSGLLAEPPSLHKFRRLLGLFGPAAIVASVSIGAGETIVVVKTGSWAGYGLLWLVLTSVLVKGICVTYLLGRYTAISGELIGNRLVRVPGPRGWLLLTVIALELLAAGPLWAAIARPSGDLMYYVLERALHPAHGTMGPLLGLTADSWRSLFATAFILAAIVLGTGASFASLERQQVIICAILVAGTVLGTLMVRPDVAAAFAGLLQFGTVPKIPTWAPTDVSQQPLLTMTTTFGYVGGTVMCYIAYANWIAIHGWGLCGHEDIKAIRHRAAAGGPADYLPNDPSQAARLNRLAAPLRWDVGLGALVLLIVSGAFMLAGAAVLYPQLASGKLQSLFDGWGLLTNQSAIWSSIHPSLVWIYYVCVLAALWGTLQSYPQIYSRVTHEFLAAIWPAHTIPFRFLQGAICGYVLVAAVALCWTNVPFTTLTAIVSFLASNAGVAAAMLGALYLNFQLPGLYRTRWWMLLAGLISAAILVAVTAVSGWELARNLVGS